MNQTLINQVTSWREGRRFRAYELHQEGWKQKNIAAALGVTRWGVTTARRAWLTAGDVLNTLPVHELRQALRRERTKGRR